MSFAPGMLVLGPGQGQRVEAMGNVHLNKAVGADTGGAWAIVELHATGANPPLHLHEREDEAFYVLEGGVRVWIGDAEFEARAGSFVLAPRGVQHTYARLLDENLKMLVLITPAGFEQMFDELAQFSEADQQDPAVLGELAARYGVRTLGPPRQ